MKKEVESKLRCFKELVNLCKSSTKAVTVFINKRKAAAKKAEEAQQSARAKAEAAAKKEKDAAEKRRTVRRQKRSLPLVLEARNPCLLFSKSRSGLGACNI